MSASTLRARGGAYLALFKPRVMSLVVFTALVGWVAAPGDQAVVAAIVSVAAIAAGGGAAGALNMWYDADIDAAMARTRNRPIPSGRVSAGGAGLIGLAVAALAIAILAVVGSIVAAALLAFTIAFYVVAYTMWLKRRTSYSVVIGGLAGALPPAVAWTAKTGAFSLDALLPVAIILVWTPPHSWALALMKREEYRTANVPILPNTHGIMRTRMEILGYSLLLVPVALLPAFTGLGGFVYAAIALAGALYFLHLAWRLAQCEAARVSFHAARLFGFSLVFLFLLFATLAIERLVSDAGSAGTPAQYG